MMRAHQISRGIYELRGSINISPLPERKIGYVKVLEEKSSDRELSSTGQAAMNIRMQCNNAFNNLRKK